MNKDKTPVVCFGGEDWWYHNRGHIDFQLMKRFAQRDTTLYINSIVMQKPKLSQGKRFWEKVKRKLKSIMTGLKMSDAGFWVYSPFSLPVHHIPGARTLNEWCLRLQIFWVQRKLGIKNPLVWVACPAAAEVAVKMPKEKLVYQRTDVYELYPNVDIDQVKYYDKTLKDHADITVFVNQKLYGEEEDQCKTTCYLDHGVDFDLFSQAEKDSYIPEDIKDIPKPIVGFFGSINGNNTVDVELIEEVADTLKDMSIVLIGKQASDCSKLFARDNVYWLGQKDYPEIPHYGKCFDVAIMPWRQNEWIQGCNPIKLKEYLALGKPIVTTPFTELQYYPDVVYQAKTPQEFSDAIRQGLDEDCPEKIQQRKNRVQPYTWDAKAQHILDQLNQHN